MKRLGLAAAALVLLSVLVVGVVAAAWKPGTMVASTHESGSLAKEEAALDAPRPMITDASIFSQFGFCDDDESAPSY